MAIKLTQLHNLMFTPFGGADLNAPATSGRSWTFTLRNEEEGSHITLRTSRAKGHLYSQGVVVEVMNGSENSSDFALLGVAERAFGGFTFTPKYDLDWRDRFVPRKVWRDSRVADRHTPRQVEKGVKTMLWLARQVETGRFTIHPSGNCAHCGRKLTEPESIESGLGPICRSKL